MKYTVNVFLHSDSVGKTVPSFDYYPTEHAAVEALAMWLEDGESPGEYLHTLSFDSDDRHVLPLNLAADAANLVVRWRQERRMRA